MTYIDCKTSFKRTLQHKIQAFLACFLCRCFLPLSLAGIRIQKSFHNQSSRVKAISHEVTARAAATVLTAACTSVSWRR